MNENIFEACEWFETASRHYAHYAKETTPEDDPSFELGNSAIEEMNIKINNHDDAVRRHNYVLEEYRLQLEKL